jgi:hypothetical protein
VVNVDDRGESMPAGQRDRDDQVVSIAEYVGHLDSL